MLSYWLGPKQSYLWVVTGAGVTTFVLPDEERLAALVRKYQSFLEDNLGDPIAARNPDGVELWRALIEPGAEADSARREGDSGPGRGSALSEFRNAAGAWRSLALLD